LSWFHVASLVVVLVKRHTVQGPLTTKSLKGKHS
jgi:hypothetical protein